MLIYNTFRSQRYIRTEFVEGRYLLASEGTDLELEVIDLIRENLKKSIGDIAINQAFEASYLSSTEVLISPGYAWFDGLPFTMKDGYDSLVSGSNLAAGIVPSFVSISDSTNGKVITFNSGGTTPTGLYDIVITAQEQVITASDDPFLENANLSQPTGEKVRLYYTINVVLASVQTETPIPYTDDTTDQNLVNQIIVTPTVGGNGSFISLQNITGSEIIDGRSVQVTVLNNPSLGGGNPIPNGSSDQNQFENGTFIDSVGQVFHLNAIFNDVVSTQVILRLDQEVGQPNPIINNNQPYILQKMDVYYGDDNTGLPEGKLFWTIGSVNWDSTNLISHPTQVVDLRNSIITEDQFYQLTNEKFTLTTINGGNITLASDGATLSWSSNINIVAPSLSVQTISAGNSYLLPNGFLVYELNLLSGGVISKGNLSVTTTSTGTSITLSGTPNLNSVNKGNVLLVGSQAAEIININSTTHTLTLATSISVSGSATIFLDSYAANSYITDEYTYTLANQNGSLVWIGSELSLSAGQTGKLGSSGGSGGGITQITLMDVVDTTLPSGSSATIDGISVSNSDTVLFTNLGSGNNQVYQVSGVGTSLVWSPIAAFSGGTTPTTGDLVIVTQGTAFANQIAEFNGSTFQINNPVRYFNGQDFWEQSAIQTTSLSNNTSGTIFSVTALGSENIIVDFSINRATIKEVGTIWITNNGTNATFSQGGTYSGFTGLSFSTAIVSSNIQLNYTLDNSGSGATFKYTVKRWSDSGSGPTGVPTYNPNTSTIVASAFVMSDGSGTAYNCLEPFNVSGFTQIQLNFTYFVGRNSGSTVGDLDIEVNGQRVPRFLSGVTLDQNYTEISNNTIQFSSDLTITPLSIEIIKRV